MKPRAPWFFEVRALIDKRPNLVPTGLGNSQTAIDADIILNPNGGADAEIQDRAGRDGEETSEVEVEDNDDGNEDAEGGSDEDEDDEDDDYGVVVEGKAKYKKRLSTLDLPTQIR